MISFASPWWLPAGIITSLLFVLYDRYRSLQRQELMARFGNTADSRALAPAARFRDRVKQFLVPGGIFCCFLALAGPQYGYRLIDHHKQGVDILFALDSSLSMLTPDTRPNRLTRSKLAIDDFVGRMKGARVGLLPFAGSAHLFCPLTTDYRAFRQALFAVDTDLFPDSGSDLGNVIETATELLQDKAGLKILLVISDGEDLVGNGKTAAEAARRHGISISTVGVGNEWGELVPAPHTNSFVKDRNNVPVRSRLQRSTLAEIAEAGGGHYADLGIFGDGLAAALRGNTERFSSPETGKTPTRVPQQRSEWPMALALILFCTDFLVWGRNGNDFRRRLRHRFPASRRFPLLLALVFHTVLVPVSETRASEGEQLFAAGDFAAALAFYEEHLKKSPDDPPLLYNTGTTLYRTKRYQEAISLFDRALLRADDGLREKILYNRGNAWFRLGQTQPDTFSIQTIRAWEQAIHSYAEALSLNPGHSHALENRDLVLKLLQQMRVQRGSSGQNSLSSGSKTSSTLSTTAILPMTRTEALRVLQSAAEEEGRLDLLLPRPAGRDERSGKNW